ncbi:MAG: hypothetical protein LBQ15_08020 [Clostridium sp.]|jgi:stage V sporulation protein B|nr:hypothetical protein [Clostridium sp.]
MRAEKDGSDKKGPIPPDEPDKGEGAMPPDEPDHKGGSHAAGSAGSKEYRRMNQIEVKRRQIQAVSGILGMAAFLVVGGGIGNSGITYFAVSWECLSFFSLLLSDGVPDALARLLNDRSAKGQNRKVPRRHGETFRRNVLCFQLLLGVAGSLLLFGLSEPLAKYLFRVPYSALAIRIMAPAVFLKSLSAVLQGYFQGSGTQLPTAAASVLRQIFFFGFGCLFGHIGRKYGESVSALLRKEDFTFMYGAAGLAASVLLAEVLLFLFLLLIYVSGGSFRRKQALREPEPPYEDRAYPGGNRRQERDGESFFRSVKNLYRSLRGGLITGFLYRLPVWLGFFFGRFLVELQESTAGAFLEEYGGYYGKYLAICIAFAFGGDLILLPLCVKAKGCLRRKEYEAAETIFSAAVHAGLAYSLFAAVFTAVLSRQVAALFFSAGGEGIEKAARLLSSGSALVVFLVLGGLFTRLLIFLGKSRVAWCALAAGNAGFLFGLFLFPYVLANGVSGLVPAGLAGGGIWCAAAGFFLFRAESPADGFRFSVYRIAENLQGLLCPWAAAGLVGLLCLLMARFLAGSLGNGLLLLLCLVVGKLIYWVVLALTRSFPEKELIQTFGGRLLLAIMGLFRLR